MISMKIISVKSSHLALEGRVRNKEGFSWISVGREKVSSYCGLIAVRRGIVTCADELLCLDSRSHGGV